MDQPPETQPSSDEAQRPLPTNSQPPAIHLATTTQTQQPPEEEEEERFDLQSILLAGITLATANVALQQVRGLTILHSIASGSDEGIKTELGKAGVFTLAAKILNGGVATQGQASSTTILRTRLLATAIIWIASIAHAENKMKGTVAMIALIKQLGYFLPCLEKREREDQMETTDREAIVEGEDLSSAPLTLQNEITQLRADLHFKAMEDLIQYTGRALWSLCYGIPANQQLLFAHKGVHLLTRTLRLRHKDVEFETRYTAAGALWHAAMQPEAASTIVRLQGAPSLIDLSKSENHPATETFVPCLTLCALLNNSTPDCVNQLVETGALQAISSWVRAQNVLSFQSPFVWTTLKPLVSLLESKFSEVNELGCFMTVAEVCNKSEISKMFTEGVVSQLERFVLANNVDIASFDPKMREDEEEDGHLEDGRRCTKLNSYMASIALSRLLIDVTQLRMRTSTSSSSFSSSSLSSSSPSIPSLSSSPASTPALPQLEDTSTPTLTEWLKSLGLGEVEEVLLRNQVNFDNIIYLEEDRDLDQRLHLPLGPLRKLSNAIKSLRTHRNIGVSSPPSTTSGSTSTSASSSTSFSTPCLICMDATKEVCFVPCGHVAVCETCSQILRARKDPCLICRTPIETFVKLYFV